MAPGLLLESQRHTPDAPKPSLDSLSPLKLVAAHFRDAALSLPPEPTHPVSVGYAKDKTTAAADRVCRRFRKLLEVMADL